MCGKCGEHTRFRGETCRKEATWRNLETDGKILKWMLKKSVGVETGLI